jgi:hypothetical protein
MSTFKMEQTVLTPRLADMMLRLPGEDDHDP